jgi:phosphoserine phosphatase
LSDAVNKAFLGISFSMEKNKSRVVYVVDLDYTIVNVETTSHFFEFLRCQRLLSLMKPFLIFAQVCTLVFFRLFKTGIDFSKYLKLRVCLKNLDKALIDTLAHRYVEMLLGNNSLLNEQVLKFLSKVHETHLTVLLTASISPIANCFYDLGFRKVYSSEIVYRNKRFHRIRDLYRHKHIIIKAFLNFRDISEVVIIDDLPEKEIIELTKKDQRLKIINPRTLKATMR